MQDDVTHAVDMSPEEAIRVTVDLCARIIDPAKTAEELKEGTDTLNDDQLFEFMLAAGIVAEWAESVRDFLVNVAASRGYRSDGMQINLSPPPEELD